MFHSAQRGRRRREKGEEEKAATRGNEDDKTKPFLSRKQRKLALQRGEVVLESNHSSDDKMNHRKASFASELQKQALLAAAEAGFSVGGGAGARRGGHGALRRLAARVVDYQSRKVNVGARVEPCN